VRPLAVGDADAWAVALVSVVMMEGRRDIVWDWELK